MGSAFYLVYSSCIILKARGSSVSLTYFLTTCRKFMYCVGPKWAGGPQCKSVPSGLLKYELLNKWKSGNAWASLAALDEPWKMKFLMSLHAHVHVVMCWGGCFSAHYIKSSFKEISHQVSKLAALLDKLNFS